ncbi:MAG: MBL fold metallo-hydrolase [Syntrophobacteraceae bacterium]|jgi:glyoxylase-like metal-dependent hydrolase (beta-lactamase superfamily II)|nr:MBL fold metallo-hydrolase [Syntrophobacteraceae bacterium]
MIFETFMVGMLQTNCYLVGDEHSRKAVVIDPGGDSQRIARRLREEGLELSAILNTHAHFDHVMECWMLKSLTGGEIIMHPGDEGLLSDRMVGMGAVMKSAVDLAACSIDRQVRGGDQIEIGSLIFHVIETPGHTPGHVSFHLPREKMIFVGDTLFAGSIGRTDFPGGSYDQLIRSVREKIFTLPGETLVYPGHGPETTVDRERTTNPFF